MHVGLDLDFVFYCVFVWVEHYLFSPVLLVFVVCCVGFNFFSTKPRDWGKNVSEMGRKTVIQSM